MKRVIFLIALNCFAFFESRSQGFSHVYQTPLLLNPSFAGSTGGARLALATNFGKTDPVAMQNNYLSFDHLLKKSGIGLGGAIYTYKNEGYSDYYKYQTIGGSIAIAPKYVLNTRQGTKRATLSPPLGLSYAESDQIRQFTDYSDVYQQYQYPGSPADFGWISERSQFSKDFKLTAGLMYNSEKLILGLVFNNRWVEQQYDTYKAYNDTSNKSYSYSYPGIKDTIPYFSNQVYKKTGNSSLKGTIQTLDFHFSKVIKFGSSKFSMVPSVIIGAAYYKRKSTAFSDISFYKQNVSLQLNYGKVFFGGGLASATSAFYGFVGYKNDKIKVMGCYNTFPNTFGATRSFELSLNYNLKFKRK